MSKSNRIMCFLFALAILILVFGQNVNAAQLDTTSNDTPLIESGMNEADDYKLPVQTEKVIKKKTTTNTKEEQELEDISLSMEDVEVEYGDYADLNVITDPVVDEGILSYYVHHRLVDIRNLSVSPASFSLNTINYEPGTYNVEAIYTGSLIHKTSSTNATLKINPGQCYITNIESYFNDENNINFKLNLEDKNGRVYWGNVNIYSADQLITSLDAEGFNDEISFTLPKEYNNEVLFFEYVDVDGFYETSRTPYYVNIAKYHANMYMPRPTGYQGSVLEEPVTFYTDHVMNDGVLDVYVDGDLIDQYIVEDSSVLVDFNLSEYTSGVYSVYLDYYGSDVYEDMNYLTNLSVRQVSTTLYTYNVTGHRNDSVNLRAGVYNYVDDTSTGLVEFFIDNVSVQTLWVDDVNAVVDYVIPEDAEYGEHDINVVYYGSARYASSGASAVLNVTRYSISLSVRETSLDDDGRIVVIVHEYSYNQTVDDGFLEYFVDGVFVDRTPVTDNNTRIVLPDIYEADKDYMLTIKYVDSQKFDKNTLTTQLQVPRINTTNRLYARVNSSNILNITSYIYADNYQNINEGTVTFQLDNTYTITTNVTNNTANIQVNLENYTDNKYNITSTYNGSKKYQTSQNNTSINYTRNKKTLYIQTPNNIKQNPGTPITININLTDYQQNTLPVTTTVTLDILGNKYPVWTDNGQIKFTTTIPANTTPGKYNITITSEETQDYKQQNKTITLNIYKDTPYITSQNTLKTNMGETIQVNATLNLNREKLEENITAILKINNKTVYQGIFKNGEFQYKLVLNNKYTNTEYNITIISIETNKYQRAEKEIKLVLNPRNTTITSHNIESKNGEQIIINATIYDAITRTPVKGTHKACIKINDVTLDNILVTNGQLLYAYTNDYSAKDYNIKIIYGNNGIYTNSTWNGTLTIKSSKLQIATHNMQTNAYSTINIKANILSDNKAVTGPVNTVVKINNKTIHEETITGGKLSFNYKLPEDIGSGTYNLTIIAGDTRKYSGTTSTVNLTVNKNYKQVITSNITATRGQQVTISARLADKTGNLVSIPTKINIKVAGHTITDYNITNGLIEYDYIIPEDFVPGNYNLLIQAGETSGYYHATSTATLTVNE